MSSTLPCVFPLCRLRPHCTELRHSGTLLGTGTARPGGGCAARHCTASGGGCADRHCTAGHCTALAPGGGCTQPPSATDRTRPAAPPALQPAAQWRKNLPQLCPQKFSHESPKAEAREFALSGKVVSQKKSKEVDNNMHAVKFYCNQHFDFNDFFVFKIFLVLLSWSSLSLQLIK